MKVGDRVSFKSRMWPETVLCVEFNSATGEYRDVTGQGLYCGRGRIVGIDGDNYTVREEKTVTSWRWDHIPTSRSVLLLRLPPANTSGICGPS